MREFIFVLLFCSPMALADFPEPYYNQAGHVRTLTFEGWKGSYIESTFVPAHNTVRFDYCKYRDGANRKSCERLHRPIVHYNDMDHFHNLLVKAIADLREKHVKKLEHSFFSRLLGGPENDSDVHALSDLLQELEREPLRLWVVTGPNRGKRPTFNSPRVSDQLAEVFRAVFESTPPPQTPEERPILTGSPRS